MCLLEVKIRFLAKTEKGKYPEKQEFSSFLSLLLMLIELAGGQTAEFRKAIFLPSPDL